MKILDKCMEHFLKAKTFQWVEMEPDKSKMRISKNFSCSWRLLDKQLVLYFCNFIDISIDFLSNSFHRRKRLFLFLKKRTNCNSSIFSSILLEAVVCGQNFNFAIKSSGTVMMSKASIKSEALFEGWKNKNKTSFYKTKWKNEITLWIDICCNFLWCFVMK